MAAARADLIRRFGHSALDRARARGELVRVLPGIYCASDLATDRMVRVRAVSTWAGEQGAVTGPAALMVWGAPDVGMRTVDVVLPANLHRRAPDWVRVLRTLYVGRTYRVGGIRVVEPGIALVHAWNSARGEHAVGLVVDLVRRRVVTVERIRAAVAHVPRVRARRSLLQLGELLDGGITSYLEYLARSRVFTGTRFPRLLWQHKVKCAGRTRYLDAYDPEAKIALEFDGRATHNGDRERRDDIERDAEVAGLGIVTLRFTFEDITVRPAWCIDTYLAARRARIGA